VRAPRPVAVFRLRCEDGSRRYVRAYVWSSLADLRANARATGTPVDDAAAFCRPTQRTVYRGARGVWHDAIVAELHFALGYLSAEVIPHECMHAALEWARRAGLDLARLNECDPEATGEERIVTVCGRLAHEMMHRAMAAGCYDMRPRVTVKRRPRAA
jgi:hypothetical protein